MQFLITKDRSTLQKLKPIFVETYKQFLFDNVEQVFDKTSENCLAASVILDSQKVRSFAFHREIICINPDKPSDYLADSPLDYRILISQIGPVLSLEWLTVAPELLGTFSKVQPADIQLGVSLNFMQETSYGGIMGFSRQDTKTDKITMRFGTNCHGVVDRFGIPCGIMMVENGKVTPHPIKLTEQKVKELVKNRENHLPHLERKKGIAA